MSKRSISSPHWLTTALLESGDTFDGLWQMSAGFWTGPGVPQLFCISPSGVRKFESFMSRGSQKVSSLAMIGFFTADFWSSLVYESAVQKPWHWLTWDFSLYLCSRGPIVFVPSGSEALLQMETLSRLHYRAFFRNELFEKDVKSGGRGSETRYGAAY